MDPNGVFYDSNWKCFAIFESPLAQAMVAIECIEIFSLLLIAVVWPLSQRKIKPSLRVVRWYNFGLALVFWIIYAVFRFIVFFILNCPFIEDQSDVFRLNIAESVFYWTAAALLMAVVLMPICRGLDRLRDSPPSWWERGAKLMMAAFTICIIVVLAIMISEVESAISDKGYFEVPRFTYVPKVLSTTWFAFILVGIDRIFSSLRSASSIVRVPRALIAWTTVLAFSLFAYGFIMTFFAFWDAPPVNFMFYSPRYLAENVPMLLLPVFFYLLALFSVVQVARELSGLFANLGMYEAEVKPEHTSEANEEKFHGR